jgi:two-component system phosphate regulon sensor histidine kinase PhoR
MKKANFIHKVSFLFIMSSVFAAAYALTRLIFGVTGHPPEPVDYILSGLLGMILMPLVGRFLIFQQMFDSLHGKPLMEILNAMSKIAQGDFNVFVDADEEHSPYSEVADSVNKMARELGSLEKLRQDFISNVSHEIQSPLTSISGYASLLMRDGISPEQIIHYATIIEAESKRLSKLSDNLLRLSVLEADGAPPEVKAFRLNKQLESIILMLEPQWSQKNIILDVSMPVMTMNGNEDLLSQVWINLLHNAIKFTPENGGIHVVLGGNEDNVICTIADNGIGISPEDQIHIFERFYKVDKARDRSLGGNGLGLSLVKKIVEMHGGQVTVESELGKGSIFKVIMPKIKEIRQSS